MEKLMPPLVSQLRRKVKTFRDSGYVGATDTSRSLLNWWFKTPHMLEQADLSACGHAQAGGTMARFQYYFAQREALETIVYLYDVADVQDKHDMMRFDAGGLVSGSMFDETWRRFVIKMATGNYRGSHLLTLISAFSVDMRKICRANHESTHRVLSIM